MKKEDIKIFAEGITLGAERLEPIKLNPLLFSAGIIISSVNKDIVDLAMLQQSIVMGQYALLAKLYLKSAKKCCVKQADIRIVQVSKRLNK